MLYNGDSLTLTLNQMFSMDANSVNTPSNIRTKLGRRNTTQRLTTIGSKTKAAKGNDASPSCFNMQIKIDDKQLHSPVQPRKRLQFEGARSENRSSRGSLGNRSISKLSQGSKVSGASRFHQFGTRKFGTKRKI